MTYFDFVYNIGGDYMKRTYALIISLVGLAGVILTAISTGLDNTDQFWLSAFSVLKYFTIQSNLMVTIYFGAIYFFKWDQLPKYKSWLGGVTVYITITFLVFVTLLQSIWHPVGIGLWGNILNHYVTPIFTIIFLVLYRKDYLFTTSNILQWLIYPLIYIVFVLISGLAVGDYIYPFFQINEVGVGGFLIVFFGIMMLFFLLSIGAVMLTRKKD